MPTRKTVADIVPLPVIEKAAMTEALEITGSVKAAAKALQIDWRTLYRRIEDYGIPYEKKKNTTKVPVDQRPQKRKQAIRLLKRGASTRKVADITGYNLHYVSRIRRKMEESQ